MNGEKYYAAPGSGMTDEQAQVAGERIAKWQAEGLDPESDEVMDRLLESAKDPNDPLHDLFEWDVRTAADLWRRRN